jgi:hypothetical protein
MGFHKSNLLQHVLTSQILMDRIRVHRFTLQLIESYCIAWISAAETYPLFFTLSFRRWIPSVQQRWF